MALHFSHIARYAPSIQSHIHLKSFAQILTIVMKHPLIDHSIEKWPRIQIQSHRKMKFPLIQLIYLI
ncbi:hypothetical protein EEL40_09080 [Muribaculaceae bacterium Isolate-083 (Janvier)]|nr:hypothetical protein EEL40_09080 [Muribaculaceae bacterium Isolate-083 (Janvier)]